jgi:hypothetical protein
VADNRYDIVPITGTRIDLVQVPKGRRIPDKYQSELSDLRKLLSQHDYLDLFSIHETGHVIYFEKAGVTEFEYVAPLISYQPKSDGKPEDFAGQWAAIKPKNFVEPPVPDVDLDGFHDWLFHHAKAFAAGGVLSREFTTTDYGGDINDRRQFGALCNAAYRADTLIGVECMWIEAQKCVENELKDGKFVQSIKDRMPGIKQKLYFSHLLKGHCKTGHTGSLQKRPWEGSRNLDVVRFRSLFGQV